ARRNGDRGHGSPGGAAPFATGAGMSATTIGIALRSIFSNKLRSTLTTMGILIGVASVIILVAVGSGTAAKSRQQLEALGSNTLTVSAGGFGAGARGGTQSRQVL